MCAGHMPPGCRLNRVTRAQSVGTSGGSRTGGDNERREQGGDEGGEMTREQKGRW